ncbi:hypothetical protein PVE_R2G0598 [Pseudomonas veronii 1YdBTEX2]|uniref:Uncharacterized protein n=2 Tax=Pseudomonas TaxID=286 RepID=A0A1D3K8C6_PSEVE|nr:hypothetical protein A7D21_33415 [Pseudomonas sp. AP19]SBW84624.1 hypothetical protein PVE_R2G0598 [Pseudomonas veronii 1YdBTEX2]
MNAVDAGATHIHLTIDHSGEFSLRDNGKGFQSREEVESFWETFGTPHTNGDAFYGRFRIGRGQIMSYASTKWRSGHFEMNVDLEADQATFGYGLTEHERIQDGCTISGNLYMSKGFDLEACFRSLRDVFEEWSIRSDRTFESLVQFVPIPVSINSVQVNSPPSGFVWDREDDRAWYKFDRNHHSIDIYNMGVFVESVTSYDFGVGGIICSKIPFKLNLARNSVLTHECETWAQIKEVIYGQFAQDLKGVKRLNRYEASALLHGLCHAEETLALPVRNRIKKLRFLPDIFGALRSPDEFLKEGEFTLYDGVHTGIAEHVQRHSLATVVMPQMFLDASIAASDHNAKVLLGRLRAKLYGDQNREYTFRPFEHFVSELSDISTILKDEDLSREESLVLGLLRRFNRQVANITLGRKAPVRKIVAGNSDCFEAWTDGKTFIAFDRIQLSGMRWESGSTKLINLLVHEYSHVESSVGNHDHDLDFYQCFHEAVLHRNYGGIVNDLFKNYLDGLVKLSIVPSAYTGTLARRIGKLSLSLPKRGGSKSADSTKGHQNSACRPIEADHASDEGIDLSGGLLVNQPLS